jgi:hypothetical protein
MILGAGVDPTASHCRVRVPSRGRCRFVHGQAPVTHGLLREARLSLLPITVAAPAVLPENAAMKSQRIACDREQNVAPTLQYQ